MNKTNWFCAKESDAYCTTIIYVKLNARKLVDPQFVCHMIHKHQRIHIYIYIYICIISIKGQLRLQHTSMFMLFMFMSFLSVGGEMCRMVHRVQKHVPIFAVIHQHGTCSPFTILNISYPKMYLHILLLLSAFYCVTLVNYNQWGASVPQKRGIICGVIYRDCFWYLSRCQLPMCHNKILFTWWSH